MRKQIVAAVALAAALGMAGTASAADGLVKPSHLAAHTTKKAALVVTWKAGPGKPHQFDIQVLYRSPGGRLHREELMYDADPADSGAGPKNGPMVESGFVAPKKAYRPAPNATWRVRIRAYESKGKGGVGSAWTAWVPVTRHDRFAR